jgi:hypothetical protein
MTGNVSQFMGLASAPGGFVILTACQGVPRRAAGVLLAPSGQPLTKAAPQGEAEWRIEIRLDEEAPPVPSRPGSQIRALGGVHTGSAIAFVFVEQITG